MKHDEWYGKWTWDGYDEGQDEDEVNGRGSEVHDLVGCCLSKFLFQRWEEQNIKK